MVLKLYSRFLGGLDHLQADGEPNERGSKLPALASTKPLHTWYWSKFWLEEGVSAAKTGSKTIDVGDI
jgi:hypothetical protein